MTHYTFGRAGLVLQIINFAKEEPDMPRLRRSRTPMGMRPPDERRMRETQERRNIRERPSRVRVGVEAFVFSEAPDMRNYVSQTKNGFEKSKYA